MHGAERGVVESEMLQLQCKYFGVHMASIIKRQKKDGTARYQACVRVAGYPARTATFDKRGTAAAWAAKLEAERRLGRVYPEALAEKYTVAVMIDRYLDELTAENDQRHQHIAEKRTILGWWRARIGETKLSRLSPSLINECRQDLLTSGRKGRRSAGTVNRYLAALSRCLTVAYKDWCWLAAHPMDSVKKLREPRGRVRFLSDAEREALLAACQRESVKPLYLIVVLAISTGARRGELLGMMWRHVDLKRGSIILTQTKNGEYRALHITGLALSLLTAYAKRTAKRKYVFASRHRDRPMDIEREWRRAVKRAKLRDFRFHDLRHTTASYLAQNGATTAEIGEVLGHKTLNMVKRYAHLTTTHTASVVGSMNAKVFGSGEAGCDV